MKFKRGMSLTFVTMCKKTARVKIDYTKIQASIINNNVWL